MSVDAGWALQVAVVAALKADADLKTAMGISSGSATVLDHVPENQSMPYVEWEDNDGAEWDTGEEADGSMGYGTEHTIRLYAWSDYEGRKQAKAMLDAIGRRLRDATDLDLTANGHRLINIRRMFSYVQRDPDLQAFYGVIQFRAVTEEVSDTPTAFDELLATDGLAFSLIQPTDLAAMWQGFTEASTAAAIGSPVGRVGDASGQDNFAVQLEGNLAKRPTLRQDGDGLPYLEFNTNQMLTAVVDGAYGPNVTLIVAANRRNINNTVAVVQLKGTIHPSDFLAVNLLGAQRTTSQTRVFSASIAVATATTTVNSSPLNTKQVHTATLTPIPGNLIARSDGVQLAAVASNWPADLILGSAGYFELRGSTVSGDGTWDLYGALAIMGEITPEQLATAEAYMASLLSA